MPQEVKADAVPNPGTHASSPAGWSVDLADAAATRDVLEKAFDYRGDVTLTLKTGAVVEGYLFDRTIAPTLDQSRVRLMCPGSDDKVTITWNQIQRVAFSDRDPAAGKSFETWLKKYVEKKLKGEKASIESESLD